MAKKRANEDAMRITRRTLLQRSIGAIASTAFPMPSIAQSRPFDGIVLRGASYQHRFLTILQGYIPEFERQTGMKVDLQLLPFTAYNAMIGPQLMSGSSAFDFVNVTFFMAARWVRAGLLTNLDEFTNDPNLTPSGWNPDDFVDGAQLPYRDAKGATYGYAWEGGATVMGLSRMDLMERKGLKVPRTFEELRQVCSEVDGVDGVRGFVSWQLHHWCLIPYLQDFGGDVFRAPPEDATPSLDTPEAAEAVQYYVDLLKCAPTDVLTYSEGRARQMMLAGRTNAFIHSSSWITPILFSDESRVRDTSLVTVMPAGPVRDCPAANSQGLGIPRNAKNRTAAWEFIKWALSSEMCERVVKEHHHSTICRRSIIQSEAYRTLNTVNGQDLGALYLDVLERPAKGRNYMAYRTMKEFPAVGEAINEAVQDVAMGRSSAREAVAAAQQRAMANLRNAAAQ